MKSFLVSFFILLSVSASANTLFCEGNLEKIRVAVWQGIYAKPTWHDDFVQVCALDGSWKGVPAEACKFWASSLQTALYTGHAVEFQYKNSSVTTCDAMEPWDKALAPSSIYFLK